LATRFIDPIEPEIDELSAESVFDEPETVLCVELVFERLSIVFEELGLPVDPADPVCA
jgi:hypothetical protein